MFTFALCAVCTGQAVTGEFSRAPLPTQKEVDGTDNELPLLDENVTLEDCLKYAVVNNPGLHAAHERWQATMEMIPQAKSLPDPVFSYTYYVQEVETRVGPQRQRLTLSQMVPWFGKRGLRGDAAAKTAEAAWMDLQTERLQLLYRVSVLYYDLYYLKETIDVTQGSFDLLKGIEAVARERYRAGLVITAVMQAQVELGKLEERLRSLNELRVPMVARFNAALNRDTDALFPWPSLPPGELPELDAEAILNELRVHNPELGKLTALAEKEELSAELARKDSVPDVTLGLSVIETGDAMMSGTPDSGKDPIMATVSINLPIWRDKYRAREREAGFRQSSFLEQKMDRTNSLEADAKFALYQYEDAKRKIDLYRDTLLPKAEQSFGVAQQSFQTGKAEFLTVIDAQRILLEFQLAAAKARSDQGKRYAEIQMLVGTGSLRQAPEHE